MSSANLRRAYRGTERRSSQGSSSTVNVVSLLPRLQAAGINVKVIAAISEELFDRQSRSIATRCCRPPLFTTPWLSARGRGASGRLTTILRPLTDAYSLTSDWDHQWRTGGLESEVVAEAYLDPSSIYDGICRFAADVGKGWRRQEELSGSRCPSGARRQHRATVERRLDSDDNSNPKLTRQIKSTGPWTFPHCAIRGPRSMQQMRLSLDPFSRSFPKS